MENKQNHKDNKIKIKYHKKSFLRKLNLDKPFTVKELTIKRKKYQQSWNSLSESSKNIENFLTKDQKDRHNLSKQIKHYHFTINFENTLKFLEEFGITKLNKQELNILNEK